MKSKVAFICVHNSCRSQMAEAFANYLGSDVIESYSAGTEKYHQVKPLAVEVMKEKGISMDNHFPKLLTDIPEEVDILITMGCGVVCPFLPSKHEEDWGITDPSGGSIEDFRNARDIIEEKVKDLIYRIENNML
ncbi:MAG: arsenate reductase ArsC [Gudongella sp.]|nr:arsenate reductase ArsC [Gudongella sp.]